MAKNLLGILIGAALDRRDGDSGAKGAVEGYMIEGALKLVVPLAITFAIGWGVQKAVRTGIGALSDKLGAHPDRAEPA
jgi:hypothetical protein